MIHKKVGIFLTLFLLFAFFAQPALAVSYYVNAPLKGSKHIVKDITNENNVQAFDGALTLNLGENNLLWDTRFDKIADEQQIELSVYDDSFDFEIYYKPVSPLFKIDCLIS